MRALREFKEVFYTPAFYVLAAVFLALSGYKFYSLLLSYTDLISIYPDYIFGTEIKEISGIDVNKFLFPKLFEFYSYMIVVAVPVLSSGLGHERLFEIDKIELGVGNATEFGLIMRKIFFVCSIFVLLFIPTLIYPLFLSLFTTVDWGLLLSSYIGVILLAFMLASICAPLGLTRINFAVSVFLNLVLVLAVYIYFIEPFFASFWFGVIRLSMIMFILTVSVAFLLMARRFYISTRVFG
jgi:ABC-2 type transport system permease protein